MNLTEKLDAKKEFNFLKFKRIKKLTLFTSAIEPLKRTKLKYAELFHPMQQSI